MTDDRDDVRDDVRDHVRNDVDDASGIPERSERSDSGAHVTESGRHATESGRHVTESGRHATNRNIVPRSSVRDGDAGPRERFALTSSRAGPSEFDVVTPVRPQPRDVFEDEDAQLSHDSDPGGDWEQPHAGRAPGQPGHERRPAPPRHPQTPDHTQTDPGQVSRDPFASSMALDRTLRVVAILAVFGLGAAGLGQPTSVLRGGIAWLGFLFFVLAGWGTIVARVARAEHPDAGQRVALGAAGYLAVGGVLVALGVLTRPAILVLVCVGFTGFVWREATAPAAIWHGVRDRLRWFRGNPALGALVVVLALFACVRIVGAVAALDRNPWDDDLAYTPLIKRLLDTGNQIEPFSFRRLGAYGGQTVLQALGAARGTLANVHLIDRGLGLGTVLLLVIGYARERRTQAMWLALIALAVLVLPDAAINTASYWTGVVCFLALYRCVVREQWALVGLFGAVTCTLRQNFLATVAAFVAAVLISRLVTLARAMPSRAAWHHERRTWAQVACVALAVIAPWWIAAYLSSHTFLFPIVDGTWNHALSITPAVVTWPQELEFFVSCCVDTSPITVVPILAVVLVFVVDSRFGRPLTALVFASVVGFVLLVHGLVGSEAYHVWRYEFAVAAALAIVLVLEVGADDDEQLGLAPIGRWILLAAFVLQISVGRGALPKQLLALFDDVREAAAIDRRGDPNARAEQRRYTAMQAALPIGAPVIVMLDDAALLDYRRNAITNLDTPGFASPDPQLPMFRGAEPLRAYLIAKGYRYAAFVRSDSSRYFFRRGFWIERMFIDAELFQIMSAYTIDAIDNFAELATTTRVLYDSDGLVVLDLASPLRAATTRATRGDESARRGAWVRELADREGLHDAWTLATRDDLRFEDGTAAVRYTDGAIDDPKWYEVTHPRPAPAKRGIAMLPVSRRAHLRVRGATDMRLVLRAAVALNTVFTHPRLDLSLDGELLTSVVADADGRYAVDVTVPRDRLAGGWHDLYLVFSSVADPGRDTREIRIARLESVEWSAP